ncbi:MAG: flagellin [Treponema sp.]|jgi:flagellin|nr:flagellin [Treponema sp.]
MIINHNLSSIFVDRSLGITQNAININIEKLSSGLRINKAADDASGLAVSEKLRSQIRGLNQADKNLQNGVSFIQTAEGYLQETQDILHRLRDLSVQSANGIYTDEDREQIQVEVSQLVDEVGRIASQAQFNGLTLLTGAFGRESETIMQIQVGANQNQNERMYIEDMSSEALGVQSLKLTTADEANQAIDTLDKALKTVSKQRADLGAFQNRFENAQNGVQIGAENLQAAESRIRDVNIAAEAVLYTKNNILAQSGTAMLAQANARTQSVLQLF